MKINAHTWKSYQQRLHLVHRAARQITASIRIMINTILPQAPKKTDKLAGRHLLANPDIK
jgi:hypothetical protein